MMNAKRPGNFFPIIEFAKAAARGPTVRTIPADSEEAQRGFRSQDSPFGPADYLSLIAPIGKIGAGASKLPFLQKLFRKKFPKKIASVKPPTKPSTRIKYKPDKDLLEYSPSEDEMINFLSEGSIRSKMTAKDPGMRQLQKTMAQMARINNRQQGGYLPSKTSISSSIPMPHRPVLVPIPRRRQE